MTQTPKRPRDLNEWAKRMDAPAGRQGFAEGLNLHENRLRTERRALKRSLHCAG
jgi:hypothetical protein